jgi:uroporphyrinogen-III synthase
VPSTPVLVTRPEPGASGTAERLRMMGYTPIVAPLLSIETLPAVLPAASDLQAILVASRQGVPPLPASYFGLSLFAVGQTTAATARRHGFADVKSANGDAPALAALAARALVPRGKPLLLSAGLDQGHNLQELLKQAGFTVLRREVYAARPASVLPEAARAMIRVKADGRVLLFSRETALCLGRLVKAADLVAGFATLDLAAISQPVADAVGDLPWRTIRVAMQPTENAVLALLND